MQTRLVIPCAILGLVAALQGQTTQVSPSALTNAYGGINNSIPWGPFVPTGNVIGEIMVHQIDDQLLGQVVVLRQMAFRHQYTAAHVAKAYQATVTLADAATAAAGISSTFANNFKVGGARTVVFSGTINFPAVGALTRPPAPFDAPVPFTTPHVHAGTDSLLWEVIITASNPVAPTLFYERGPGTTHVAGWVGTGCPITGGVTPLTATGSISGTAVTTNLSAGPLNAPALLLIGDTSNSYFGAPLPLNLAFIGSPACDLNINFITMVVLATTASGTVASSIPYTMSPALSGTRLRMQWLCVDAALAIVTSNGLDHSFPYNATTGRPWPQNRVYANGWSPTPPATGSVPQNNGLVTEWTY